MRYLMGVLSILAFLLLGPPSAGAQESSLAGLAKKTKKERDEKQADPKVIRSDDLRHTRSRVYVPPGSARPATADAEKSGDEGAAGGEGAEDEDAEKTPAEERAAQAQQYQEDLALQQDRVSKLQEQIADAEAQLADQTTYYPGNPRRASLMELIEKCNVEIADAQRTIAEIRRAARAQGISLR